MEVLLIYWFDIVRSINYSQKVGNKQPVLLINQEALFYFFHLYPDALPSPNLLLLRLHRHKSLFAVVSFIVVMYRLNTERTCLPSIPDSGSVKDESLLQAILLQMSIPASNGAFSQLRGLLRTLLRRLYSYDSHGKIKNIDVKSLHLVRWADGRLAVAETFAYKTVQQIWMSFCSWNSLIWNMKYSRCFIEICLFFFYVLCLDMRGPWLAGPAGRAALKLGLDKGSLCFTSH